MYQSAYTLSLLAFQKGVRALASLATSFCRVIPPLLTADPPQILRTPFCGALDTRLVQYLTVRGSLRSSGARVRRWGLGLRSCGVLGGENLLGDF